jgi:putative ABC transport system permease protein
MFRYSSLILKNSLRNRRRTVLTGGSIAISLCLLGVLMSMYRALFMDAQAHPAQALRLIVHHKVSVTQPMPVAHLREIQSMPGVRNAMVWQWFGGTYKDARDPRNFFARFAVNPEEFFGIKPEIELLEDQKRAFQRLRTGCIVGRELAARFNWKTGDRVVISGDIFPVNIDLTIVGTYTSPDNEDALFFSYAYLRELAEADSVGVFLVQVNSPRDVQTVAEAIDKNFENSAAPTRTETERAWQLSFISFLGNLKLFVLSISGALTFTMLLVAANTISMSVRERAREVGILKTLGFTPGEILWILAGESAFIGAGSGVVGIFLTVGLCRAIGHTESPFAALEPSITPGIAGAIVIFAVAIGLAGAFLSAWSASRRPIVAALRSVA